MEGLAKSATYLQGKAGFFSINDDMTYKQIRYSQSDRLANANALLQWE